MIQKTFQVGNSVAVIIPKKVLDEKNIKVGDAVNFSVDPVFTADKEIHDLTQRLIKQYRPALEELASK
ncbi:MAG TPA: AbrB/MazE/SpoVT family DNA-binding domain-containing protein [Candidatus Saccharimonadales bacterium]|nr:AbrB/MazE/SpoVT family DNA-binding domain-containing protein [Candidatus Saccharimonadales bacterium]